MTKEEIISDPIFIRECQKFGLNHRNFKIYGDVIVLDTSRNDIKVFMDKDYNTFRIHKIIIENLDIPIEEETKFYSIWFNYKLLKLTVSNNIKEISYKQILDIFNLMINKKELYTLFDSNYIKKYEREDNIRTILFICFLGREIKKYFLNAYNLTMMDLDYISLDEYFSKLIKNIRGYIHDYIDNDIMIFPTEVLKQLKLTNINEHNKELLNVICAILEGEAYEITKDEEDINILERKQIRNIDI